MSRFSMVCLFDDCEEGGGERVNIKQTNLISSYSEFPMTVRVVATFAVCPLCGAICWLTLMTQISNRTTTTRSSRTPRSPRRDWGEPDGGRADSREGEDMDTTIPTQHRATRRKNKQSSPPMVPRPRTQSCSRRGASHRYSDIVLGAPE